MMLNIEKDEVRFISRFWLAYLLAAMTAIVVMLQSGAYETVCMSSLPITAAFFYFVFSALVGYIFIFLFWVTLVYYRVKRGVQYIGLRYFWPMYACLVVGLAYSACFLRVVNVFPGTKFSLFTLKEFFVYIEKHHCAAVSFLFEDFPLGTLMIVSILALPIIYYMLLRAGGVVRVQSMNSSGTLIHAADKLPNKYIYQFYFHLIFIALLILILCILHYLIFFLIK